MKPTVIILVVLLASLQSCKGFLCYTQEEGGGFRSVTFCTNSCYSTGAEVFGFTKVKKGCADNRYRDVCQAAAFLGLAQHACFCNGFLCNASSVPTQFMPLLFLPLLLWNVVA